MEHDENNEDKNILRNTIVILCYATLELRIIYFYLFSNQTLVKTTASV